ncbi:hypothetical protein [Adhaeribacter aquaticus]|uniref:hypothetical protein n=1 Tax=Adhaeribacter aquaticus TaxID=299567 RepID=UPI0003F6A8A2|nr:hypothetical protein [Adhaeribacter aquaticus]
MINLKAIVVLILTISVIVCLLFRGVIFYPNDYLFAPYFDGIKNYYTFIYYILFDKGFQFSGMNYPFGEHIIFTDNQPLFAYPIRLINTYLFDISDHLIGIFNYIILTSFLIGGIIVYAILRSCLLPNWYSLIAAVIIVFFSQQNVMFGPYYGAYALSYCWVIPLQWLLILKSYKTNRTRSVLPITLVFFLIGFIHPYYYLSGLLLVVFHLIFNKKVFERYLKFTACQIFLAVAPIIAFKAFLFFSDASIDRPETPVGLTEFRGEVGDIFYPWNSFTAHYLQPILGFKKLTNNGYGYVGLVGTLCLVLTFINRFKYLIQKKVDNIFKPVLPFPLRLGLFPAIAIALFALGFPFKIGLEFLYDYLPFLKQFRVLARFLWIFYYLFSVYMAFYFYQLYRFLRIQGYPKLALLFLVFILIGWAIEAKINIAETAFLVRQNNVADAFIGVKKENIKISEINKFNDVFVELKNIRFKEILNTNGYNPEDFQAILPFPYFTAGSEKITFQPLKAMPIAMAASIQTSLPLINGMMSRTSLEVALKTIQLLSNNIIQKELIDYFPSDKPILLIVVKGDLQYFEKDLIQKGELIFISNSLSLYKLPLSAFKENNIEKEYKEFLERKDSLYKTNVIYTTDSSSSYIYSGFNNNKSTKFLFTEGALTAKVGPLQLYKGLVPNVKSGNKQYVCSVWVNLSAKSPLGNLKYIQTNELNQIVDSKDIAISNCIEIYKDWVNVSFSFKLQSPNNKIRIFIEGKDIIADEFLVRPSNHKIYMITPQKYVIFNNYFLQ